MNFEYFGFKRDPFADALETDLYCPTHVHEEALKAMKRWAGATPGALMLVGEAGCGKTMLAELLGAEHARLERRLDLTCVRGAGTQVLEGLCRKLGVQPGAGHAGLRTLTRIRHYLRNKLRSKGRFLIVVDQAQELDADTAEQLSALVREDGQGERGCQILLIGRTGAQTLLQHEGRALRRQVRGLIQLSPMSLRDTTLYVAHRLAAAAATTDVFDAQAIARIHALGGGNPRRVNRLCTLSLQVARAESVHRVTVAHTIEAARLIAEPALPSAAPAAGAVTASSEVVSVDDGDFATLSSGDESFDATLVSESASARTDVEVSWGASDSAITPITASDMDAISAAPELEGGSGSMGSRSRRSPDSPSHAPADVASSRVADRTDGTEVQHAMDSLIANGEALLARLEDSLHRTESEEGAASHGAGDPGGVETRLTRALGKAEHLIARLHQDAERITRVVEVAEGRATQAANVYQNTARLMLARVENAQSISRQLTAQLERLEAVSREARESEWRLQQTRAQQGEWTQRTDELSARLEQARQQAERTGAELARSLRGGQELSDGLIAAVQQGHTLMRDLPERLSKTTESLAALTRQTRAVEQLHETFQRSSTGWKASLQSAEASATRAAEMLKGRTDQAASLLEQTESSMERLGEQGARIEECRQVEEQTTRRCADMRERVEELRRALEAATARADRSAATLHESIEDAGSMRDRLAETSEKLHEGQQHALDRILALGAACERAGAAEQTVTKVGELVPELQRAREQGEASIHQLHNLLARADRLAEFFRDETAPQGPSQASRLLERLTQARERAAEALVELVRGARENEARMETAKSQVVTLTDRVAGELQRYESIRTSLAEAEALAQTVRGETAVAQDRLTALASHIAAATSITHELAEHHQQARTDLKEVCATEKNLVETRQQIDSMIRDVWEIGASAQAQGDRLGVCLRETQPLLARLDELLEQSQSRTAELGRESDAARQQVEALRSTGASAGGLVEKLTAITHSLHSAKALRESLVALVAQAATARDALADTQNEVQGCLEQLRGTHDQALVALGEQRQLHDQSVASAERLENACRQARQTGIEVAETEARCHESINRAHEVVERAQLVASAADDLVRQLADKESTVEVGDRMLREFLAQAQSLSERLKEVHVRTGQIERQIVELSAEPQRVVLEARQQADQLDKVCKAVQKVFAGLSKVSLDATKRIEDFRKTSHETDARLERLATETEQAAGTLKEWVEEAIRAQSRLAATLAKSPSVLATHPQQKLQALSSVLDQPSLPATPRIPRPPRREVEEAGGKTEAAAETEPVVRPRTRAQVITDLVRDAQRASQESVKA